jgi:hypothetical protein
MTKFVIGSKGDPRDMADFVDHSHDGEDVLHTRFVVREIDDPTSNVLRLIALVPIFCDVCGIE